MHGAIRLVWNDVQTQSFLVVLVVHVLYTLCQISYKLLCLCLGLSVYSSDSESDSGKSPDVPDSKGRSREGSKSSSTSSSRGSKSKGSKDSVTTKLPNPEEIAAAFKDTSGGSTGKEKSPFMPVPRIVHERQKDTSKSSSSKQLCCDTNLMFV